MNMRVLGTVAAVVMGALVAGGCQPSAAAGLSDADRAALKEKAQIVMKTINAKDYAGWAAMFVDDAEWMPANGPVVHGRAAIQADASAGAVVSDLVLTQVDVDGRGDLAYVRGNFTLSVTPPGATAPVQDKGKYIELWRKQADGSWKASKVMVSSDVPLPPPPPAKK